MFKGFVPIALVAIGLFSASAFAQSIDPTSLKLGDQAPNLDVTFVKGTPITLAEGKGADVYIVEFWATWCAPCLKSIPHLTKLQKKYGHQGLVIVGITDENPSEIDPFLAKMGSKMDYRVAIDRYDVTASRFMAPFGVEGIPHAFVIDKLGRLVWHGHPMDPLMERLIPVLLAQDSSVPDGSMESDGGSSSKDDGSDSKDDGSTSKTAH